MSIKLSFWIRSSQKNNQRKAPIYLRIQQDDIRTHHSVGEFVIPSAWDKKAQRIKGNSEETEAINGKLDALKARALKISSSCPLFNTTTVTPNWICYCLAIWLLIGHH